MSVQIIGGVSGVTQDVGAASRAGKVTLYDAAGVEIINPANQRTYRAFSTAFSPPATPTDMFTITGSGSMIVRVLRMSISTLQTVAGINEVLILKRSAANTGGTSAAATPVPCDSADAAATATPLQYTANPTLGAVVTGRVWAGHVSSAAPASVGVGSSIVTVDFIQLLGKPITLRGVAEVLAWNFNGAALPTGLSVIAGVIWTEATT